jgi:hypothetical protein
VGELRRASAGNLFVTQHLLETLVAPAPVGAGAAIRIAVDDELAAIVPDAEGSVAERDHASLRAMVAHAEATDAREGASLAASP